MLYGFKRKLLCALLLTNTVAISVLATFLYLSFQSGFTNYLDQVEIAEVQSFTDALCLAYGQKGSWDFLRHKVEAWGIFLRFLPGRSWEKEPPEKILEVIDRIPMVDQKGLPRRPGGPPPQFAGIQPSPGKGMPDRAAPGSDLGSLNWRLRLLDQNGQIVFGKKQSSKSALLIPLKYQGKDIGSLSIERIQWLEKGLATQFQHAQLAAVVTSAIIALIVSMVIALLLGRKVFEPIGLVINGIRKISRGNLDDPVTWKNKDEFQPLVNDVNQLAQTLAENRQLRRTMMADVSHELRTPIAVLQAGIEAIQDRIRPCDKQQLDALHKGVLNLSHLVDDLFSLSLADAGNLSYSKRKIDAAALLRRILELYHNLFTKNTIQLKYQLPAQATIYADPDRFEQVIANVLNNSYRYTDSPGEVIIKAMAASERLEIRIEDSTPGVTRENQGKIFDRFFRVDKSRSREHGGSGLGLSLCRSIVEAHGGTITAYQSPLGGLGIVLSLPLIQNRQGE